MATETMALRGTAGTARMIGLLCVADSKLGGMTKGQSPVTMMGGYLDVVDGDGRTIPWQRLSRNRLLPYGILLPINVRKYPVRLSG